MHILRFPYATDMTALRGRLGGDLLFFRQDDLDLFDVLRNDENRHVVITGNPGTAKSWFQPKVITLLARPDIYRTMVEKSDAIYNNTEQSAEEAAEKEPEEAAEKEPEEAAEKGLEEATETLPEETTHSQIQAGTPKLIYRMITKAEVDPVVFDLEGRRVLSLEAAKALPGGLDREENWVLYEPSDDPAQPRWISYEDMKFIMTVSPLRSRYKQFIRDIRSAVYCMPCATLAEMLVMGKTLSPLFPERGGPDLSEEGIRSSFKEFGPFPRYMLAGADARVKNRDLYTTALVELDPAKLLAVRKTIEESGEETQSTHVSHWLLAYQHRRYRRSGRVVDFLEPRTTLEASNPGVLRSLKEKLRKWNEAQLFAVLSTALSEEKWKSGTAGVAYEEWIKALILRGAKLLSFDFNVMGERRGTISRKWKRLKYPRLEEAEDEQGDEEEEEEDEEDDEYDDDDDDEKEEEEEEEHVQEEEDEEQQQRQQQQQTQKQGNAFGDGDKGDVKWADMQEGILYCPKDSQYPFVDMMWRVGNELFAVQVSTAKSHPKGFSVFSENWLRDRLGIADVKGMKEKMSIRVFYAIHPTDAKKFLTRPVPASFMWTDVERAKEQLQEYEGVLSMAILKSASKLK
eukprot:scaffold3447_cov322-Pinguiococcus_pyrenoidosus.AAC.1